MANPSYAKITAHSKKLMGDTANKARQQKLKSGEYKQWTMLGKAEVIDEVKTALKEIEGSSAIYKLKFLIDFYHQNK